MPVSKPFQFDPAATIRDACDELAGALLNAKAAVDRVDYLKDKLLADFETLRSQADTLEVYDETEAAMLFKLDTDPRKARRKMYELRSRHKLPHIAAGRDVTYTKQHLREIAEILEVNGTRGNHRRSRRH